MSQNTTRTCAYVPCSKEFEPDHWRQIFCTPTCRANQHYVDHPEKGRAVKDGALRCVADGALDLVRGDAEEAGGDKARWTLIVREQIAHTLLETGWFSVRDLYPFDIPAEHMKVCTSQIGSFASSKYMVKRTWQKSEKVSRKGGPYWTFQITERGREKLPAELTDVRAKLAGLDADPERDSRVDRRENPTVSVQPGETGPDGTGAVGVGQEQGERDPGRQNLPSPSADTDAPEQLTVDDVLADIERTA